MQVFFKIYRQAEQREILQVKRCKRALFDIIINSKARYVHRTRIRSMSLSAPETQLFTLK